MTQVGTIKLFQPDKGFGFITAADGSDVFLHIKECVDGGLPQKGDTVAYDVTESSLKPGQKQASNVTGGTGVKGAGKQGVPTGTGTIQGNVKNFNSEKGFGFIIGPDGADIFLHIKAVADGSVPQAGDYVSYDSEPNPAKPGQNRATNVSGGTGGGKGKGKGKDNWGGDSWGGDGGYGAAGNWDGGKGKGGPYGDGGKGDAWGKGGGKDDWMSSMMNMMWDGGWGGKGDAWGGKGDAWGGKGDNWGGKGEGWAGDGKGDAWGGKGDAWGGKGEGFAGKGKGDGKGESFGGKGDGWAKGDSWGGKGEGGKGDGFGCGEAGKGCGGGMDGYQGAPTNGAATMPQQQMFDPNAMGAPNGAAPQQQQWGGADGGFSQGMPPQGQMGMGY